MAERDQHERADTRSDVQKFLGDPPRDRSALVKLGEHLKFHLPCLVVGFSCCRRRVFKQLRDVDERPQQVDIGRRKLSG